MINTVLDSTTRFESLETILRTKNFRRHGASIRVLIPLWIKSDDEVRKITVETTLRAIVRFLDNAPGLQKHKKHRQSLLLKELVSHMQDIEFHTELTPCILKILEALRYEASDLYALSQDDMECLVAMIVAVRKQLAIELPPPERVRGVKDAMALHELRSATVD